MLKPLIWGSQGPDWEDQGDSRKSPWHQQTPPNSQSQHPAREGGFKRESLLEGEDTDHEQSQLYQFPPVATPSAFLGANSTTSRLRGTYDPNRGSALLGPLSVNDPQLDPPDKRDHFILSESFFNIASPFGPFGVGNDWRVLARDAPEHVHRLLRAFVAAHDYAGAARALATLHRLHSAFDPDVYRYTLAVLRLAGDHQKTSMYFRKVLGKKTRSITNASTLQGRAIAHDFLAYLADMQKFDEALNVSENFSQGGSVSNHGGFKVDPSLRAHGGVLRLFAALLEYQTCGFDTMPEGGSAAAAATATGSSNGAVAKSCATAKRARASASAGEDDGVTRHQHRSSPSAPRLPGLQDPLALIGQLRACWGECMSTATATVTDSPRGRAREHLRHAKRLLDLAAKDSPGDASVAGYRAAVTAAESGTVAALRQLAGFVEGNPGSVKGCSLHARLVEMNFREAQRRGTAAERGGRAGSTGSDHQRVRETKRDETQGQEHGKQEKVEVEEEPEEKEQGKSDGEGREARNAGDENRLLLMKVARARALRGWLEADPLEPRAALALASLHSTGSGAVVGVADRAFVVDRLVGQLETSCGLPRSCASPARGVLHTSRATAASWAALADLLGPLRVRDEPVPVWRRGRGGGNGVERRRSTAAAPTQQRPTLAPRPGTIWDHLYGLDPPWAPTDFGSPSRGRRVGYGDHGAEVYGAVEGTEEGAEEAKSRIGGFDFQGLGYSPHSLLRGVDRELWEETAFDPDGDPLLVIREGGGVQGETTTAEKDDKTWCSEDEDCVSDDESDLLQECSRLASRRTGGCLYYSPPGGEEAFRPRAVGAGGGRRESVVGRRGARMFFETTIAEIVLEGMTADVPEVGGGGGGDGVIDFVEKEGVGSSPPGRYEGSGAAAPLGLSETSENMEVEVEEKDGWNEDAQNNHGRNRGGREACPRVGRSQQKITVKCDGEVDIEGESNEEDRSQRAGKRRRRQQQQQQQEQHLGGAEGAEMEGSPGWAAGSHGGREYGGSKDRIDVYTGLKKDDADGEDFGVADEFQHKAKANPDRDGDSDGEDPDNVEDGDVFTGLREQKAPLSRPIGTDPAATRLSETIAARFPDEAAVWLLANKCCVAGHMFGPRHRYCLEAIGRLCREDVRDTARSARAALRSRGFRLQLSLTRLAADRARAEAARLGKGPGVAWGLPDPPPAEVYNMLPSDSYVPEPIRPVGGGGEG